MPDPESPVHPPMRKRGPRSDAARNRVLVADAAVEVFTETGLEATVADVARRAKVGNATVFRHFPTKADLLGEVTARWLEAWGTEIARRMEDGRDDSLRELLEALFERLRRDRFTLDILRSRRLPDDVEQARVQVERLLTLALGRAVDEGRVRPDVTYADLTVLVLGLAGRLAETDVASAGPWRRCASLAWAAIEA